MMTTEEKIDEFFEWMDTEDDLLGAAVDTMCLSERQRLRERLRRLIEE